MDKLESRIIKGVSWTFQCIKEKKTFNAVITENHFSLVLNKSDRVQENGPGEAYYLGPGASIQWFSEQVIKRQQEWGGETSGKTRRMAA